MESCRNELLKGVYEIPMGDHIPGNINVFGSDARPIIVNEKNQVFLAAATYGQGRVVVFSHNKFTDIKSLTTKSSDQNMNNLYQNIKEWLSYGAYSESGTYIKDCTEGSFKKNDFLVGQGGVEVSVQYIERLREFVQNGGRLVIGETPWGFLQKRPGYTISTMPMNILLKHMGMAFTEEKMAVQPVFRIR